MVTTQQLIAVIILCLFVGICIGMLIWFLIGHPKCEHNWEKIKDATKMEGNFVIGSTIVFMCKKCGKIKRIDI